ncbi:MAG: DUF5060 domain-containing protein [Bryobacterales bacterium]|nr:DUF5060 domain-containing protein [Bryobacterales bacterium]
MVAIVALALAAAATLSAQNIEACESVPVYDPCEIVVELDASDAAEHASPATDVELRAEYRSPKGGRTKVMPAFWDGGYRFVLRFSPDFEGRWDYRLISNIGSLDRHTGSFEALPAQTPGFIEVFNTRYFKYPLTNTPHYWLGDSLLGLAEIPWEEFEALAERRSEQGFTHVRVLAVPPLSASRKAFSESGEPDVEHFRALDRRVERLHSLGIVTDLVLGNSGDELDELFPRLRAKDRYIRYLCARYAAYSVTWQILLEWESHEEGGKLLKQLASSLSKHDPYSHPMSTGATVTSAPLAEDGWQDYFVQNRVDPAMAAIEYELNRAPFVNTGIGVGASPASARRQAWNAAVRGHYVTLSAEDSSTESPFAEQMVPLKQFFSQSRYYDLQPHYRIVGGAALALHRVPRYSERTVGIEHVVYAEEPGLIELVMPKQEYSVSWYNPANGAWFDQKKKFKGDRYRSRTPDDKQDWVLYIRREGKKQDYNKSFVLESKLPRFREVEFSASELPFEIQLPEGNELQAGRAHEFNATLLKNTIAAKRTVWLWMAEAAGSARGARVLGTTQSGSFSIPAELTQSYPTTLSVRAIGLDGAGRLFEAFRTYSLQAPE